MIIASCRGLRKPGRALILAVLTAVLVLTATSAAAATPRTTRAYYVSGASAAAVEQSTYNDACAFAHSAPPAGSLLMLDFGAARVSGSTFGTLDFTGHFISNSTILKALESAANGAHNCYGHDTGTITIAYGTSNYRMTQSGMSTASATAWGQWQATRENELGSYETANHYRFQSTAVGVDMEPAYDQRPISNQLVNGAGKVGGDFDYDYGSADGCPTGASSGECYCNVRSGGVCRSAWTVNDLAYASFGALAVPIPEIYVNPQQKQWAEIQRNWDAHHRAGYFFAGVTAESGAAFSPGGGWSALAALARPGTVDSAPGIICFGC